MSATSKDSESYLKAELVKQQYLWVNGELVDWDKAQVHITSVGWASVSGIFESMRCYWNADQEQLFGWQFREHYARFQKSLKMVRIRSDYSVDQLIAASRELLRANKAQGHYSIRANCYHKNVTWFGTHADEEPALYLQTVPSRTIMGTDTVVSACISTWRRLSDNAMSPRIKCYSNYQNSRTALLEAELNGYDQAILLNDAGYVAEGAYMCLFMVRDGKLITPDIASGILESCTRFAVIDCAREALGLDVIERSVNRSELYMCDELFFCGSGAEIMPIGSVDRYTVGDCGVGPVTRIVQDHFKALMFGEVGDHPEWRTPIYDGR